MSAAETVVVLVVFLTFILPSEQSNHVTVASCPWVLPSYLIYLEPVHQVQTNALSFTKV